MPGPADQRHRHVLGVEGQQAEHASQQLGRQDWPGCRRCCGWCGSARPAALLVWRRHVLLITGWQG
jgi:hypothetical protein